MLPPTQESYPPVTEPQSDDPDGGGHETDCRGGEPRDAEHLDLRGLKCPLPVLRTRKAMRRLAPGSVLVVLCTDPLAAIDIPHLVREEGWTLVRQKQDDGTIAFTIVVA